ncbi:hypothetical protein LJC54_01945 [Parabacteroides sp. OttesenSCG-928-J18]|nr:hypothetical protein [Parabacteroides sp. OttesenSCG-928-J18]
MATIIKCPHCGNCNTKKTSNGKLTDTLAIAGSIVGGALLQMAIGVPGIFGTNVAYGRSWHQYCCLNCHNAFQVRLGVSGYVKEIKK